MDTPKENNSSKHTIIAISGRKGVGKDTVGLILSEIYKKNKQEVKMLKIASKLKDVVSILFGWERNSLDGFTKEDRIFRDTIDTKLSTFLGCNVTPRTSLEEIGEILKNIFGPKLWMYFIDKEIEETKTPTTFIITDLRDPVEYTYFKERGAYFVHIKSERNIYPPRIESAITDLIFSSDPDFSATKSDDKKIGMMDVYMILKELQTKEEHISNLFSIWINFEIAHGQANGVIVLNDFESIDLLKRHLDKMFSVLIN
jgi:ABC-type dipeptide/oligopeptide/nickel transport system ATPase subunit